MMNDKDKPSNEPHKTIAEHPKFKPFFTRLTPAMSRKQMRENLVAAIEQSGFKVKRAKKEEKR
jgi:hypothetical protein